jgi:hypothetical protein
MYKVHLFQYSNTNPNLIPFSTLILGTKVPQSLFYIWNSRLRTYADELKSN